MRKGTLRQLIPGNPGTSFVVALFYAISQKYKIPINNDEQFSVFTKGIVNCRKVFFSGIMNEIASRFNLQVVTLTNNRFLMNLAKSELDKKKVSIYFNQLEVDQIEGVLDKYTYLVMSVDLFHFRRYHDYHFICASKKGISYSIFEPKRGIVETVNKNRFSALCNSVNEGLGDVMICFCL